MAAHVYKSGTGWRLASSVAQITAITPTGKEVDPSVPHCQIRSCVLIIFWQIRSGRFSSHSLARGAIRIAKRHASAGSPLHGLSQPTRSAQEDTHRALKIITATFRGPGQALIEQKIVSGTLRCPRMTPSYPSIRRCERGMNLAETC